MFAWNGTPSPTPHRLCVGQNVGVESVYGPCWSVSVPNGWISKHCPLHATFWVLGGNRSLPTPLVYNMQIVSPSR